MTKNQQCYNSLFCYLIAQTSILCNCGADDTKTRVVPSPNPLAGLLLIVFQELNCNLRENRKKFRAAFGQLVYGKIYPADKADYP